MAIATFPSQVQIQSWQDTMQMELIKSSMWEQMSNIIIETEQVPTKKEMRMVPQAVVIKMAGEFDEGSYQLTIPMTGKLNKRGPMGRQPADGTEEVPEILYKTVHYNVERKAISKEEMSVDGNADAAYKIGAKGTPMITNYFVELTDYNSHRSIVEGASENLTESAYWTGPSFSSAPQSRKFNPTVMKRGGTALAVYDTTLGTHEGNIQTYVDSLTSASNPMSLVGLDALISEMHQRLIPLKWKRGGEEVNFVLALSPYQIRELQDSSSTTGWSALMRNADPREKEENRAISGILGIYRKTLIIQNERAPLWNTAGSANAYTAYVTPWSNNGHVSTPNTDTPVSRAAKTGAGVGTCEIGIGLGKGAIGNPIIRNLKFDEMSRDYNFNKGLCGARMAGWVRMDFDKATPTATSIKNQTCLLYITPSPSTVF